MSNAIKELERSGYKAIGVTFRGEIWENSAGVPMAKGYSNFGKPFDIETAAYLKPVFRSIANPNKRKIVNIKAVQTLGTFVVEESISYFVQHYPGDMVVYDCDVEAARDHGKSRLMPRLKSIPGIAAAIEDRESHHDLTTTEIYLPGMTLRLWPLNESSVQRFSCQYIFISDAFLAKRSGMIDQAIRRTTQFPNDKKIIIESQGGETGDDFDEQWKTTSQNQPHVVCPLCDNSQPFEWSHYREDNFIPKPPKTVPSLDHASWIAFHVEHFRKAENRWAGFKKGPDEKVLRPDGSYNETAIKRETYYECLHCGGTWNDNPTTRRQLDHSTFYVPAKPNALLENDGFRWTAWMGQRLSWGGEENMLGYLNAKRSDTEMGNREKLRQWYQKSAAMAWREDIADGAALTLTELDYDPEKTWEKEWRRVGMVDVQLHASHFWVEFFAIAKDGEARSLWAGCLTSFDEIEQKQLELKVQHNRMWLDYQHEGDLVKKECLRRGKWIQPGGKRGFWLGWNMLSALGRDRFKRAQKNKKGEIIGYYFDMVSDGEMYFDNIEGQRREVFRFNFSALFAGDMFVRYRDGKDRTGRPNQKIHFLNEPIGADKNQLSHVSQIHSRFRDNKAIDKHTGRPKPMWKVKVSTRPDHYFAIGQMLMAIYSLWGVGGQSMLADLTKEAEADE